MKQLFFTSLALALCFTVFSQQSTTLRFNLEKNKVYKMKAVSNQNIASTYNGASFTTIIKSSSSVSFKLLSQVDDIMNIECKFDTLQSKSTSPMGNKESNSALPAKKTEYLEQLLNRFSKNTIIAKISTSGKFVGFENYKSFKDNIMLGLDSVPETKKKQIEKQIEPIIKESAIQTIIEPFFAYLPEKEVKIGDNWESSYAVNGGGMSGMIFNTLTLESVDNNSAQLNLISELESMPAAEAQMSFDIKGKSAGKLTIELKTGLIVNSKEKKKYSGSMNIKNQGNVMNIPMVIETESEVVKY